MRLLGLLEPLLERVVYEDLPANLAALKRRVEQGRAEEQAAQLQAAGRCGGGWMGKWGGGVRMRGMLTLYCVVLCCTV